MKYEADNIYNEDCYKAIKEIPDKSIDLIVTDPPYLIENTKAGGGTQLSKSIQKMNDELELSNLVGSIDETILNEFIRVLKTINLYIWCNHKQIPMYLDFFVNKHKCAFDIIIWHKPNATPLFNNKYLTDKEYCLYFRKSGYCCPANYEEAKTVYSMPINIKDKDKFWHPTIKPRKIIENLIKNSSRPNDLVLDCFLGSGTTAVACKNTGRRYLGFEINEKYFKIAQDRLKNIDANGQIGMFTS